MKASFSGSMTALITPFRDGRIDYDAVERLVEFQIANGTTALVPCGSTGESATLTHAEHAEVVKRVEEFRATSNIQMSRDPAAPAATATRVPSGETAGF